MAHPRTLDKVIDFLADEAFGIDHGIHTEALEEFTILRSKVVPVVNACHRLLGPHLVGQDAAHHVGAFLWCDTDKEVGIADVCLLKNLYGGGFALLGYNVKEVADDGQTLLAVVNEGDIVLFLGKQTCQMYTNRAGTGDDDFHSGNERLFPFFWRFATAFCLRTGAGNHMLWKDPEISGLEDFGDDGILVEMTEGIKFSHRHHRFAAVRADGNGFCHPGAG